MGYPQSFFLRPPSAGIGRGMPQAPRLAFTGRRALTRARPGVLGAMRRRSTLRQSHARLKTPGPSFVTSTRPRRPTSQQFPGLGCELAARAPPTHLQPPSSPLRHPNLLTCGARSVSEKSLKPPYRPALSMEFLAGKKNSSVKSRRWTRPGELH